MRDPDTRTDEDLVEDILDGDRGAFSVLLERYHDDVLRFVRRMVGDDASADDVFQDTFVQVHESLHTIDVTRRFRPWLFTVAANKARDALRKRVRRREYSLDAPVTTDEGSGFVDLLGGESLDVAHGLETGERRRVVDRALDGLTPRQREVLLLAYYQKLSYQDIATMFSIPVGTVKSRLHSAVSAFARGVHAQLDDRTNGDTGSIGAV